MGGIHVYTTGVDIWDTRTHNRSGHHAEAKRWVENESREARESERDDKVEQEREGRAHRVREGGNSAPHFPQPLHGLRGTAPEKESEIEVSQREGEGEGDGRGESPCVPPSLRALHQPSRGKGGSACVPPRGESVCPPIPPFLRDNKTGLFRVPACLPPCAPACLPLRAPSRLPPPCAPLVCSRLPAPQSPLLYSQVSACLPPATSACLPHYTPACTDYKHACTHTCSQPCFMVGGGKSYTRKFSQSQIPSIACPGERVGKRDWKRKGVRLRERGLDGDR